MKNKKIKLGKFLFFLLLLYLLGVGGTAFYQQQKEIVQEESILEIAANQELLDATISTIVGNEIETEDGDYYTIPVGTEVVTKLGNITTFSRLSSGDKMQMLVENETDAPIILKIWIVE